MHLKKLSEISRQPQELLRLYAQKPFCRNADTVGDGCNPPGGIIGIALRIKGWGIERF